MEAVMAGHSRSKNGVASLADVPAIHAFGTRGQDVDARDKPAHDEDQFTASSSTSKISVAFGGMTPPAPRAP